MTDAEARKAAWDEVEGLGAELAKRLEPAVVIPGVRSADLFRRLVLGPVCQGVMFRARLGEPLEQAVAVAEQGNGWGSWDERMALLRSDADRETWRAMGSRLKAAVEYLEATTPRPSDWN